LKKEITDLNLQNLKKKDVSAVFENTGFQASHLSQSIEIIEKMKKEKCTVFLGFTANLMASGLRGLIAELCKKKFVDAVVTTAGSMDHDIIKSSEPYYLGDFFADDTELHKKGINRLGNIFVPSKRFELLEKKVQPWLAKEFKKEKNFSPSRLAKIFGKNLDESSFLYWCNKNDIPVFCPGITDGAIGLQMYFFKQDNPDFCVDVTSDMKELAELVLNAEKTGAIILGGGISKHHIIGANIVRDGLDYAVYVSTSSEFDGSLSGARTHEAKSWGKIQEDGKSVTLNCDATIAFPLIVKSLMEKKMI
jgi:deoxyhypusine synthase